MSIAVLQTGLSNVVGNQSRRKTDKNSKPKFKPYSSGNYISDIGVKLYRPLSSFGQHGGVKREDLP